jgi:hypothetical protein
VPLVAGLAVLLLLGLVAWVVLDGDGATKTPAAKSPASSPGGGASSTSPQPDRPTADGMQTFIRDYLATVTTDPQAAFAMLTPGFQTASGGIDGYRGFWDTIRTAEVTSFSTVDPGSLTVGYTVAYTRKDGSTAQDDVSLQLVYQDGDYLIDGEA